MHEVEWFPSPWASVQSYSVFTSAPGLNSLRAGGGLHRPTRIDVLSHTNSMNRQESARKVASGFRITRQ